MILNNEQSSFILLKYIKNFLILSVILWGSYIWGFKYFVDVINSNELFRFIFTRHLFYYLQILLTSLGLLLFHVTITHDFKSKHVIFYFLLATILVDIRFFNSLHFWLRENNLYFDIFKTGENGTVVSFQYARILILIIFSLLVIGSFIFVKQNFKKLFLMIFSFVFFFFMYNMHLHVGRQAYKDYELELKTNIETILNNHENYKSLCSGFMLDCYLLEIEEVKNFSMAKPNLINRIIQKDDTTDEANKLTQTLFGKFLKSNKESTVFMESQFQTDNLRAACYGFKKIGEKILIIIDFKNLAYALDLYLIYFTMIVNIFLTFWLSALIWVYKRHKNIKFFNQ